uniref:Uncharacterized protein n=1 Tax=Mola mola TaxID=94237 RepID=A0A3Q4AAL1_MOLML
MATAAERRSLPSPEIMLGQPWSSWVDNAKLHGNDDMPIFGQCPAQDDFYLVMCSHCGQVVKPQALQAHVYMDTNTRNKGLSRIKMTPSRSQASREI